MSLAVAAFGIIGSLVALSVASADRFPPGMRIAGVPVSGMRYAEALEDVRTRAASFLEQGLTFVSDEREVVVAPAIAAPDEFFYDLYTLDVEETVALAFADLHEASLPTRLARQVQSALFGRDAQARPTINGEKLLQSLEETFGADEAPAVNARPVIDPDTLVVTVTGERSGFRYDFDGAVKVAAQRLATLDGSPVPIGRVADEPTVTAADVRTMLPQIEGALARAPYTLRYDGQTFSVPAAALAPALTVDRTGSGLTLALDPDALAPLLDPVAEAIEVPVREGRFKLEGDRVTEFSQSQTGVELSRTATTQALTAALLEGATAVDVVVNSVAPRFDSAAANTLGITELVAVGRTSFAGSPPNRRFNIAVAVEKLNGLLIEPGEEFSLITALGPVDGTNGYRKELVIKGDRTIPEFGGGLCQIGTTLFRSVLDAGLPVLERRNHSYRVSYYEPPVGMDATIYEPKPDFRFRNDYETTLLLQAYVEGDDLVFEFYGTKDGRVPHSSTPKVFNVTAPPKKKVIKTDELPPGEEKCLERAHPGADASFTYTVTYPDGRVAEEVFRSHYRPWQEVCLVGKKRSKKVE